MRMSQIKSKRTRDEIQRKSESREKVGKSCEWVVVVVGRKTHQVLITDFHLDLHAGDCLLETAAQDDGESGFKPR